jgi:hypothetical protein
MGEIKFETWFAAAVYLAIVVRWFLMIHAYHQTVLEDDTTFEHKEHFLFKSVLFVRAAVLAFVAPVVSLVKPSYFSVFFDGVETTKKRKIDVVGISKQLF